GIADRGARLGVGAVRQERPGARAFRHDHPHAAFDQALDHLRYQRHPALTGRRLGDDADGCAARTSRFGVRHPRDLLSESNSDRSGPPGPRALKTLCTTADRPWRSSVARLTTRVAVVFFPPALPAGRSALPWRCEV